MAKRNHWIKQVNFRGGVFQVWYRNFYYFKKTWLVSVFWIVLEPLFYLGALGFGLGSFVNNMDGVSYIDFFFPALLCTTAMFVAFFESTYSNYTKLTHLKTYSVMMIAPLGPEEIVLGELLWAATKGFMGIVGVSFVAFVLGLVDSWRILPASVVLFITSFMFACIGMLFTSYAKNYDSFIYSTSGVIIPMSLFSGTYFPLESLPNWLHYLTYGLPLTHAVQPVRDIILGRWNYWIIFHFIIMLALSYFLMDKTVSRFRDKLIK